MNGGARRGSKKGSKGKKSQRGGGECETFYEAQVAIKEKDALIKRCNAVLSSVGEIADKAAKLEAKRKEIENMCIGVTPVAAMVECNNTREGLKKSLTGGKRRGSKKGSKGKKSQRGGGQCEDYYNNPAIKLPPGTSAAALIAKCNANTGSTGMSQSQIQLQEKKWALEACQEAPQMQRGKCMEVANAMKGGKRRGSKKASKKGSKKGGAKKGSKKGKKY